MKALRNKERGQSLVELAISLLILLYLLSGAVEFGIVFFQFVQLRDAAQEGALYGSMNPKGDIVGRVIGASASPIDLSVTSGPNAVTINVIKKDSAGTVITTDACEGDSIMVDVDYNHQIFMPFMSKLIGRTTIPLHASVTDTVLTPPCP